MAEGDDETEIEPLKPKYEADIAPSAPIEEDLPKYDNVAPPFQPIVIAPVLNQEQILIEERQPLSAHNDDNNIPFDNMVVPSQEQVAAVLPSFDDTPSKSNSQSQGIGYIAGCKESPHIITWIVTVSMWTMFALAIIGSLISEAPDGIGQNVLIFVIIGCVLYAINLIETGCSAMHNYLSHILQNEGATQFIERLKNAPIEIWWTVRCYHYETRMRTVHYTDSDGNRRTRHETHREKVYTWTNTHQYQYSVCTDVSGDILGLDEHKLTRLRLHKAYQFANDITKQHYINEQEMFKRNNWRDSYQEFSEESQINGYIKRILAESEPGMKPGWMDLSFFWLFSVLGFSPCYRQKLVAACGNIDFALVKQISVA